LIGIIPGIVAIGLITDRLTQSLRQPDLYSFIALFTVIVFLGAGLVGFRRWFKRRNANKKQHSGS
jgi:hypothetical protein